MKDRAVADISRRLRYEAVNKTSVEELHDEPADMKDLQVQPVHV